MERVFYSGKFTDLSVKVNRQKFLPVELFSWEHSMWAKILGTIVGAILGWALVLTILFYFLGFPLVGQVIDQLLRALLLVTGMGT